MAQEVLGSRPYSFRYPYRIDIALLPWKKVLDGSSLIGGASGNYDQVVKFLEDRDRELETHLNKSIGQGYVGLARITASQGPLTNVYQDITGLVLTISVPANRRIKLSLHATIVNDAAITGVGAVRVLDENGTAIIVRQTGLLAGSPGNGSFEDIDASEFLKPSVGDHTYRVSATITTNNGTFYASVLGGSAFLSAEDIGSSLAP